MYIYIRKLFANDVLGHPISFPRDVAQYFFNAPESFLSKQKNYTIHVLSLLNTSVFKDIELLPATDFCFSPLLNSFLTDNGQTIQENDLLYVERFRKAFGVKLIKPSENAYNTFDALLSENDRHFLLCNDDSEDDFPKDHKDEVAKKGLHIPNPDSKYKEFIDLLERNHNLILTGAPGTGKTHLAKAIAEDMGAITQFVQFHPSYDYTDFVEGLRPMKADEDEKSKESGIAFERKDGIFKRFCKAAILYSSQVIKDDTEDEDIGSFDYALNTLKSDIIHGNINTFSKFGTLSVDGDKKIVYHRKNSEIKIKENYVRLLYEYYLEKGLTSLDGITCEDIQQTLADITAKNGKTPTGRIERSEYWWTVDALLKRKSEISSGEYKINDIIPQRPFVFIIDEINRGELSKIFGELFYAIDPGYRGEKGKVSTQYQELITDNTDIFISGFYVPENVYIIGTMNDIDRSVESMDFAVRRRFAWREVTAEESAKNIGIPADVVKHMDRANAAIKECGLSSAYYIGGAYFLKLEENDYEALWKNHIKGLVEEYFRGEPDSEKEKIIETIHIALTKE